MNILKLIQTQPIQLEKNILKINEMYSENIFINRLFTGDGFLSYVFGSKGRGGKNIEDGYDQKYAHFVDIKDTLGCFSKIYFKDGFVEFIEFTCVDTKDYLVLLKNLDSFKIMST